MIKFGRVTVETKEIQPPSPEFDPVAMAYIKYEG